MFYGASMDDMLVGATRGSAWMCFSTTSPSTKTLKEKKSII